MKIGKKGWVLRIDLVGVHGDYGHVVVSPLDTPGHDEILLRFSRGFAHLPQATQRSTCADAVVIARFHGPAKRPLGRLWHRRPPVSTFQGRPLIRTSGAA